jgi:hypothetical protein
MIEPKPWLEVAEPRRDIADGSFDESLFAADLGMVDRGRGPADYLNPVTFCEKTYLTGSLLTFLQELTARLSGDMAAAGVYRLQTEFGGGKTHTLLAAYHLFRDPARVAGTAFVRELAAKLSRASFPQANVVVLEGGALSAGGPDPDIQDAQVHTLLGELAYRLGGRSAFAEVAEQDRDLRGSSTTQITKLLERHSPCLILMDELLQYLTKALVVRTHDGNLAATTLTFIKELCTAAAAVPGTAIVATLTSSNLEDYATLAGEDMQDRLSKVVGRTENIVTPVEGDDIFPILHRRLFSTIGPDEHRRAVADAYANWYESLSDAVPASYREATYRERMATAFPFHPELVDILTNRWGSLSGFQRTRGALRTLAHTVKALSQRHQNALLIHPGDVALADPGIRGEVIRFAGESYKAALNADIIRPDSNAPTEDKRRGGMVESYGLATGLATTAFLDSFGPDKVVGASAAQMLVGGRPAGAVPRPDRGRPRRPRGIPVVHAPGRWPVPVHHRTQPQQGHPRTRGRDQRRPDRDPATRGDRHHRPEQPGTAGRTEDRSFRGSFRQPAAHPRHPRLQAPRRRRGISRNDADGSRNPGASWRDLAHQQERRHAHRR